MSSGRSFDPIFLVHVYKLFRLHRSFDAIKIYPTYWGQLKIGYCNLKSIVWNSMIVKQNNSNKWTVKAIY